MSLSPKLPFSGLAEPGGLVVPALRWAQLWRQGRSLQAPWKTKCAFESGLENGWNPAPSPGWLVAAIRDWPAWLRSPEEE